MSEQVRFSMKEIIKQDKGEVEKSVKNSKSTKKAKKNDKYLVKIVNGVKYMVLKD